MFIIIGGDGKEYGPVTVDQIRAWIVGGRANLDTRAKALGSDEWRRLGDYAEFAPADAAPPMIGSSLPPPAAIPVGPGVSAPAAGVMTALPLADRGLRFVAALVDGVLKSLCWLPTTLAIWHTVSAELMSGHQPSWTVMAEALNGVILRSLPFLLVLVLIQAVLLSTRGQSIGKLATGIRIVRRDGMPAGFTHAFFLRGTLPLIIEQIPVLGTLFWVVDACFIFGEERRCIHDYLAGTVVVKR
jgi:uncharacterized RDD family membrane protein YckC